MSVIRSDEVVRDLDGLVLPTLGEVVEGPGGIPPWTLVLPNASDTSACTAFLRDVHSHRADKTVRSYAYDLQRWFRFLAAVGVQWRDATPPEVTDFFVWMKHAKKVNGNQNAKKRDSRVTRNAITGKQYVGEMYSAATMDHNETVLFLFYEFQRRRGQVLYSPVLRGREGQGRAGAHHNPLQVRTRRRRASNRQGKGPKRLPRSIPDEHFDAFFDALSSDRDRALVAMYVSSGARPSEIVDLDVSDINLPDGVITVVRKGGRIQDIPISWDAVAWYRRYQGNAGALGAHEPAWRTLRGEPRRLTYDALRAMVKRANEKNGTNWTAHDLRHTAATRMLNQGTPERTVQEILGHASLETLEVYTVPRFEDMVAAVRTRREAPPRVSTSPPLPYGQSDMDILFGSGDNQ